MENDRIEINSKNNNGTGLQESLNTSFHYACSSGNLAIVKVLIKDIRLDINSRTNYQETALACLHGHLVIIEHLLKDARLEINSKNYCGWTPFHDTCYYEHLEIVKILIKDARLDINNQNKYVQESRIP